MAYTITKMKYIHQGSLQAKAIAVTEPDTGRYKYCLTGYIDLDMYLPYFVYHIYKSTDA